MSPANTCSIFYHLQRRWLKKNGLLGSASVGQLMLRFAATTASIQIPQFTHRWAGNDDPSLISIDRESVKLGTMNP